MPRGARLVLALLLTTPVACRLAPYEPGKATRAYPKDLPQGGVVQVQAIPQEKSVQLVNATASSYRDFDLWLNRRFMTHVTALESGQTLEVPLDQFWDERGETPNTGGWFRFYVPTRVVLMQMQTDDKSPLVGLVCTLPETVRER